MAARKDARLNELGWRPARISHLIGIVLVEGGQEVTRYFADEDDAVAGR